MEASARLGVSLNRLNEIVLGKRGVTADTALRLAELLGTSPQFWMRLQADWDLHQAMLRSRPAASYPTLSTRTLAQNPESRAPIPDIYSSSHSGRYPLTEGQSWNGKPSRS